jgi:thiamine-phosphate pyrophosphorylase
MTDLDRFPDWPSALAALPPHSGVILRDYAHAHRPALAQEMARFCRQYRLRFFVGEDRALAIRLGAGFHAPTRCLRAHLPPGLRGMSLAAAHNRAEIDRAAQYGYGAVLISPVFPTATHNDARGLGAFNFLALARHATARGLHVYALGGVNEARFRRLAASGALAGYAGISAFNAY